MQSSRRGGSTRGNREVFGLERPGDRVHPTEVDCEVRAIENQGATYLQISSFGQECARRK